MEMLSHMESLTAATMLWGPIQVRLNIGRKAPFSTANLKIKKFIKNSNQSTCTYIQYIDHISEAFYIWLIKNAKFHIFIVLFLTFYLQSYILTAGCWLHLLHWCWNHAPQRPATLHWLRKRHLEPIHLKIFTQKQLEISFENNISCLSSSLSISRATFPFWYIIISKIVFAFSKVENSWMYMTVIEFNLKNKFIQNSLFFS